MCVRFRARPWAVVLLAAAIVSGSRAASAAVGTPDLAFAGAVFPGFSGAVYAVAVQSDGKVIVGGDFISLRGTSVYRLVRLNADGTLDTAFSSMVGSGFPAYVKALALQPDGKILVAGAFPRSLARLNADGSWDSAFNANIGATTFTSLIHTVAVQSDGRIVVGGQFAAGDGVGRSLARLNADGTRDATFAANLGTGFNDAVLSVALQADGKIVAGGAFTTVNGFFRNHLVRLNTNGTTDPTFAGNIGSGATEIVQAVALQRDGRIVVGGNFTLATAGSNGLARLNSDGIRDPTFATNLGSGFSNDVVAIAMQGDNIIVAGTFSSIFGTGIARVGANGIRDLAFGNDLATAFERPGAAYALGVQPDGKVVAGGDFSAVYGLGANSLIRLGTDYRVVTLTVVPDGLASSEVSSAPAGIVCFSDCRETYREGTVVTLTAGQQTNKFVSWSGGPCGASPVCTMTMSSAATVTVTYAPGARLTVNKTGPGTVTSLPAGIACGTTCSAVFEKGLLVPVTLTATPDIDARFDYWLGCPGTGPCQVTMLSDVTVSAHFSSLPPSISNVSPSQGTTRGGTAVTLRGVGFRSPALVTIGDAPALDVVVVDRTTLTLRTPPLVAGVRGITVRNPDGQIGSLGNAFTVVESATRDPDLNQDGEVDVFDATMLTACLGFPLVPGTSCWEADLDDSGTVDRADLDLLTSAYGQTGLSTDGTLSVRGASTEAFNPVGAPVWFDIVGDTIPPAADYVVLRNSEPLPEEQVQVGSSSLRVAAALVEGRNHFEVIVAAASGRVFSLDVTLWAGSFTLNGRLQNFGEPFAGAAITASVAENGEEHSWTIAATAAGTFQFTNVPNRSIRVTAQTADGRFGARATRGDAANLIVELMDIGIPSPIDNNDFSLGLSGWSTSGSSRIVPHLEDATAVGSATVSTAAVDYDMETTTGGRTVPQVGVRVFNTKAGTRSVTVRYRFTTSEFPEFYGSVFDDAYFVMVHARGTRAVVMEGSSMNRHGYQDFDPQGQTPWRTVTVAVDPQGDTVAVVVNVANVKDALFDSSIIVDKVAEEHAEHFVRAQVTLKDTHKGPLDYVSLSPHDHLDGQTLIRGRLTIEGHPSDSVSSVTLEVLRQGSVLARADLHDDALADVIGDFGEDGKVGFKDLRRLFAFDATQLPAGMPSEDQAVYLRVVITTARGGREAVEIGRVGRLVRVTDIRRYGERTPFDQEMGGDDWARPSMARFAQAFGTSARNFSWNDFSNMNAGSYRPDHAWHQGGVDADGLFDGYWVKGRATIIGCSPSDTGNAADGIIEMLTHPEHGSRIGVIFVTCRKSASSPFWNALRGRTTAAGRRFDTIVQHDPTGEHNDHFHVRIKGDIDR